MLLSVIAAYTADAQLMILTRAGKGVEGYAGDGSRADTCQLHWPEAIAITDSNDIYIADADNNVIRRIDGHTGIITTVAGTGYRAGTGLGGYSGDGGAATAARMWYPSGVAVDDIGNLYIADQRNDRIRKVDTFGIITTVAGTGLPGFSGDGSAAISAKLAHPTRVTLDASGNLFVADSGNNRIRKVDVAGTITTVAGSGINGFSGDGGSALSAELNTPIDMAVDATGNIFIADYSNNRIRKVDAAGTISTYAGITIPGFSGDGGPATAANIFQPSGIAVDAAGNVFFSDLANFRVRKIDPAGIITTVAGNGDPGYNGDNMQATNARLWFPEGIALDSRGQLFICDKGNDRIRLVTGVLDINTIGNEQLSLRIFPNPNDGDFTVNFSSPVEEQVHVVIASVTGQKVQDLMATANTPTSISLRGMAPGMYYLSAATAHGVLNERVVVR